MVSADEVGVSRGLSGTGRLRGGDAVISQGAAGAEVVVGTSRQGSGVGDEDEVDGDVEWGVIVEVRERVCGVVAGSERSRTGFGVGPAVRSTGEGAGRVLERTGDRAGITNSGSVITLTPSGT